MATVTAIGTGVDIAPREVRWRELRPIPGGIAIRSFLGPVRCRGCGWAPLYWATGAPSGGIFRAGAERKCWRERSGEPHVCRVAA